MSGKFFHLLAPIGTGHTVAGDMFPTVAHEARPGHKGGAVALGPEQNFCLVF